MLRAMIFRPFRAGTVIRPFPRRCPGLYYFASFRRLADEPGLETGTRLGWKAEPRLEHRLTEYLNHRTCLS
jgi:hypothetical protein